MAVVATIDPQPWPEAAVVTHLDDLAAGLSPGSSGEDVLQLVFDQLGFHGNNADFYDVRNSLIHEVLRRKVGIPLSLAVIVIEVGRRAGVEFEAIGMPGHVLLAEVGRSGVWFDPFSRGQALTRAECEAIFHRVRPNAPFHDRYLEPMSNTLIVARTLENLRVACMAAGLVSQLASVLSLRAAVPNAPLEFRVELSRTLASLGRYDAAAVERDLLAEAQPSRADHHRLEALRLRAHRN